ncbi:valine--pyruvate transaminase [Photobacterium sp. WH77]|uniref:valine--pyruvate transaminase n=1 Tax=unclassified Photobacterium TaxID=2628852 RepID=UPI001EDC1702|nr:MULTISPECIES: valine--pyruvate transaminase [unclassified Photobacterium]MCG2838006.1 valine--pyruvate transaminase [Photobacterium sp. WH77]MCG2845624.1 valine--pyruvate transaminase [Photobacterium sp. WH80]
MKLSSFGQKFNQYSGITQLMDDLNDGLRTPGAIMLGGGNPAAIPEVVDYFYGINHEMLKNGELISAMMNYDGPQGKDSFLKSFALLMKKTYQWNITEKNITLTNGSQSSFFYLFNILAGKQPDGSKKRILFPMAPEYIGYADAGIEEDIFVSYFPEIEMLSDRQFKYHINFDAVRVGDNIGAICVSRPTNPTGNVLTNEEINKLDQIARDKKIPLIIDNAYGLPFPNIIFEDVVPFWNDNTILCMSLSKMGLPGLRCGIIIASEEMTQVLTNLNGIISLAPSSMGPAIANHILNKNELFKLSESVIKPYYAKKAQFAMELLLNSIKDSRFRIHKPQGAIFLWLWFDELPISTMSLYKKLKDRGVLVVPGEYFFFGQSEFPLHASQCLRLSYVQSEDVMKKGIEIIKEEVMKAYQAC